MTSEIVFSSPEEINAANQAAGMRATYSMLGRGSYEGRFNMLNCGQQVIAHETSSTAIEIFIEPLETDVFIVFLSRQNQSPVIINNQMYFDDNMVAAIAPGTEIDIATHGPAEANQMLMPVDELLETCRRLRISNPLSGPEFSSATGKSTLASSGLYEHIDQLIADDSHFADDSWIRRERVTAIIETCATALFDTEMASTAGQRLLRHARAEALRKARDWIHAHLDAHFSVADVCAYAGVGQRALQRLFKDQYGVTPSQYCCAMRLNAARERLRQADPSETTVLEVAESVGFSHAGRFAGLYASRFGESPKQTLGYASAN